MPKKAKELIDELKSEEPEKPEQTEKPKKPTSEETESKRVELLKAAEGGNITKTPAQIQKASAKVIDKVHLEWEAARMQKANDFLTDQLISKFAAVLGGLDAIEKPEVLEKELIDDPLLREDIEKVVGLLSPWIPFIGLFSGGITVGKHLYEKQTKVEKVENENETK